MTSKTNNPMPPMSPQAAPAYSSREAQAMAEVGRTTIRPALARLLTLIFLGAIWLTPLCQQLVDIRGYLAGQRPTPLPQCYNIWRQLPGVGRALQGVPAWQRISAANQQLMRTLRAYEDQLENDSYIGRLMRRPTQYLLARWLGAGNEKVYIGRWPWLFYRPEIEYLTGPGFLTAQHQAQRQTDGAPGQAPPQADPLRAILHFREQLAQRGIALIVMPTPVKPSLQPEQFTRAYRHRRASLQNPSYAQFLAELQRQGVLVCDVADALANQAGQPASYLALDTHWRPEAMELAAQELQLFIQKHVPLPPAEPFASQTRELTVQQTGDLALMLALPPGQLTYQPERVTVRQTLLPDGAYWQADPTAAILVLGDSFCNIYALPSLGWGQAAGLVERLSHKLQRPLDRITLNDNGAYATRAALSRELARGHDRLAGKQLVIYQFTARELTEGDWKMLELTLGQAAAPGFIAPPPGVTWSARGLVGEITSVPLPGSVPYQDHVLCLHLVDIECPAAATTNAQAVVYMQSMRDNIWTSAARLRPGDKISLQLQAWADVATLYEGLKRSELDEPELQLEEPCWGEAIKLEQ
ncbi:MAG: hypothetical protein GX806_01100 [Lentisphaerae bacterium]|nr:hypothetical protein [Lentisphaerota bacterium]